MTDEVRLGLAIGGPQVDREDEVGCLDLTGGTLLDSDTSLLWHYGKGPVMSLWRMLT